MVSRPNKVGGALPDAVLNDQDEDGDERQDDHVHGVQPLPYPER